MQCYWISVGCNSTNSVMTMLRRGTVSSYEGYGARGRKTDGEGMLESSCGSVGVQ